MNLQLDGKCFQGNLANYTPFQIIFDVTFHPILVYMYILYRHLKPHKIIIDTIRCSYS